jgi:hypothetical protein
MDAFEQPRVLGLSTGTFLAIVLVVAVLLYFAVIFYNGRMTIQIPRYAEPFYGGAARGTGLPDCMHSSADASALANMFLNRVDVAGDGDENQGNLQELLQILSKLSCFKKDLVSPSHIVEATRYQPFATSHDIEPIAETTGRCFAKTISPRDLEIAFDKWTERGDQLIRMLCTALGFSGEQFDQARKTFQAFVRDVKDIARGKCLQGEPSIAGKLGPRDAGPYESPSLKDLGPYNGYF